MSVTIKNKMINGIPHLWDEETRTYYPTVKEDKQTGLTYTLDPETFVYLPNLTVTQDGRDIGIWGMRRMGLSANTFYRRVREYEAEHGITEPPPA